MSNPLDNIPAGIPPLGVTPNFVNPPSKGHAIVVLDGVFVSLMLLAVLVRIYVRTRLAKAWGWDDYACIIAACGSVTHMIMYTQTIKIGFGRHLWDIPVSSLLDVSNNQKLSANGITYPLTIFFAKLSILLLYLRIFGVNRALQSIVYVSIGIMAMFYAAMIGIAIGSLVKCDGLAAETVQFCKNYSYPIVMLNSVFNVITDFYLLFLPYPLIVKLRLGFKQKLGLLAVFSAGLAACAASLARLIEFAIQYHDSDVLWDQAINAEATIVEMNIAIIVACGTCVPTFYTHTRRALSSTSNSIRLRFLSTSNNSGSEVATSSGLGRKSRDTNGKNNSLTELKATTPSISNINEVSV